MATTEPTVDEAIAEFQGLLHLVFGRARTLWRDAAAMVHPELQPAGYKLLAYVARVGTSSAHQLAESFEMDKSVVSRQVRMLEELGLLLSRPGEHDGRLRMLTVTPAAEEALVAVRAANAKRMRTVFAELTPDEIAAATKVFRVLAEV